MPPWSIQRGVQVLTIEKIAVGNPTIRRLSELEKRKYEKVTQPQQWPN